VRRADQVAGLGLLVFAVGYAGAALRWYPYRGDIGPGPGFLPVWLGVAMAVLATLLFVGATRSREAGGAWLPGGKGLARLLVVFGATALFTALLDVIGMISGTALFLIGILRFLEGYPWGQTLAIAVGIAALNFVVFTYWLQVPFPVGVLGF
jgi:putative tricarboxylic transport membrane protein